MKRSEMLELIKNIWANSTSWRSDDIVAEKILRTIEEAGMLPPGYLKPIPFHEDKQYPLVPGDFLNEKGEWCTPGRQEWEPEE